MVSASAAGPEDFPLGTSSAPGKSGPTPAGPSYRTSPQCQATLRPCQLQAPPLPSGPRPHVRSWVLSVTQSSDVARFNQARETCSQNNSVCSRSRNSPFPYLPSLPTPLIFRDCFPTRISKWLLNQNVFSLSLETVQGQGENRPPPPTDNRTSLPLGGRLGHRAGSPGRTEGRA